MIEDSDDEFNIGSPHPSGLPGDEELADRIRELWVGTDMTSGDVAKELGIKLGRMNRIIHQYKITKLG